MEDNEFEEVTIISHTDQAASILPQQTAERLMKEIRMEVTQKISQTENVKMGSLQHSEATNLLDRINQEILNDGFHFDDQIFFCRLVKGETPTFYLGSALQARMSVWEGGAFHCSRHDGGVSAFILPWHNHHILFSYSSRTAILDCNFDLVKTLPQKFVGSSAWHVDATKTEVYFLSEITGLGKAVACISQNLESKIVVDEDLRDFFVSRRTKKLVYLATNREIVCQASGKRLALPGKDVLKFLKQMYSDHFLVADCGSTQSTIKLVDPDLQLVASVSIGAQIVNSIRLLRPRQQIGPFLAVGLRRIILCYSYRDRSLAWVEACHIDLPTQIFCLSHVQDETWIAGGDCLELNAIEVHFPDALKL